MNPSDARRVLSDLTTAWPRAELPDETLMRWHQMLSHLPYDLASAAATAVIHNDEFFPSIARFREAFASCSKDERHEWVPCQTCPVCRGTATLTDDQGRDWLCRCAAYERLSRVHNAVTAPPPELLAAARRVLKEAP